MAAKALTDRELRECLDAVRMHGTQEAAALALGIPRSTLAGRLITARQRLLTRDPVRIEDYHARLGLDIQDGTIIIFSDAHYLPGEASTAHRALIKFIRKLKPHHIINNGDAFDGGSISRHPRIGWDNKPTVKAELEAVSQRLGEIEKVAGAASLTWLLGNHDARFETFLAANAPQYEGIQGFSLKDHFPRWLCGWRLDINAGELSHTIVKHRGKGGIHAAHNNTKDYGTNFVTGHLHKIDVRRWTDARGTRYGVDTGTLSDTVGEAFCDYTEDAITGWRSGFAVLTFRDGRLLTPELVEVVVPGVVQFRGEEHQV